jgi:G:T/U mismatch-specific DNA glycosylase
LKLVVCGTAAGSRSAQLKHYYAGPGNKFRRTLAELGLTPRQLAPSEAGLFLDFGIGLTDLVKGQSGADSSIRFNGKRAAQEFFGIRAVIYGPQQERIGVTDLFVAPSTSGAANGFWDLLYWRDLADRVRRAPQSNGVQTDVASPRR